MMSTGAAQQSHNTIPNRSPNAKPKFIRKKPQVIQSIEFSEELKTPNMQRQTDIFVEDDQLRLAEPVLMYSKNFEADEDNNNEYGFPEMNQCETPSLRQEVKSEDEGAVEYYHKKESSISYIPIEEQAIPEPMISSSPEQKNVRSRSPQTKKYENLKQKKLEELKDLLIKEKTVGHQASNNGKESREAKNQYLSGILLQKPYATTVSKDNEDIKSEYVNDTQSKKGTLQKNKTSKVTPNRTKAEKESNVKQHRKSIEKTTKPKSPEPSQRSVTPLSNNLKKSNAVQSTIPLAMVDLTKINTQYQSPRSPSKDNQQPNHVNQLLSDKTQQIFFKKLQKDVEQAIRQSDAQDQGALNMHELQQCFYNLDYLPYMQLETQNVSNYPQFGNQRNYVTTNKGLVLLEKEFIMNLWCILNPLNSGTLDNALLYDVILLLVFNVQQPVNVTSNFLTEYLENLYRDLGIDLDGFSNFNSHSQNQLIQDAYSNLSNLSKYLSYSNLWSIEKLALEFRQIHANKLSHLFSSNKRTQRESSPLQYQHGLNLQSQSTQNILINPSDGRRYKKQVVQEHLSHLTFSPSLNTKTKALDQQYTQRLIREGSLSKNRRDTSAEQLPQTRHTQYFQVDDVDQYQQDIENLDNSNVKRYDLLMYRQMLTEDKIQKAKEEKLQKMLEECTFYPNLQKQRNSLAGSKSFQNLQNQTNQVFKDLTQKIKSQRSKLFDHTHSSKALANHNQPQQNDKEIEQCTFKPQINSRTPRLGKEESIPKGYYEMINRIRKVTEEKKAMEEKQFKKSIGENYDKVKLMNQKPPTFLQDEERKQKKKKLLMYIDVNINPTKTGRIGIYEGDDVRDLAKNFQKTFWLNKNMMNLLTNQLEQHLVAYKQRHGMSTLEGSVFPSIQQNINKNIDNTKNRQHQSLQQNISYVQDHNFQNEEDKSHYHQTEEHPRSSSMVDLEVQNSHSQFGLNRKPRQHITFEEPPQEESLYSKKTLTRSEIMGNILNDLENRPGELQSFVLRGSDELFY